MLVMKDLLNPLIQHLIDGILTIDEDGCIEAIDSSACALFQRSFEEVVGQNINFLMWPAGADRNYLLFTGACSRDVEVEGIRKDNSFFLARLCIRAMQHAVHHCYTCFINVLPSTAIPSPKYKSLLTERLAALQIDKDRLSKSLESEQERGRFKSRLVAMASHEFRTPLSAIQLSAALIEKYARLNDYQNLFQHVGKIRGYVIHLTAVLTDFLSLERLDTGKVETIYTTFDVAELGRELTEEMQQTAKPQQQIIYEHFGEVTEICLDKALLKNCIINLISNAIKYSGNDTHIRFCTVVTPAAFLITVSDNGIGIPESDQSQLFEPFFRARNTNNIDGTGLGLHIVKRYVQLMDGQISCQSTEHSGTTFTLRFPPGQVL